MNKLLITIPWLMEEAGGAGGGGGAGDTPPNNQGGDTSAAQHAGDTPPNNQGGEEKKDVDLTKMSDDDWALAVMPDPTEDGKPKPDRTLLTPMAKELREAGIQPAVMQKVVSAYQKSIDALIKKQDAERVERMKELNAKCEQEVTEEEWKNFRSAYHEYIAKDKALKQLVLTTELGTSPAFIRLCALAGASIRVDTPPPATATAGSSQTDLDRAVFEQTVPKHLR